MPLKIDPDTLGLLMAETSRLLRTAFERKISEAGLGITAGEARALIHVSAAGGARQNVIAERMGVEPMTMCAYLDRLEKLGLVARSADPSDRRAKNVSTTDEADRVIILIREQTSGIYDRIQSGLPSEARQSLLLALKLMRENLQGELHDKPGSDLPPSAEGQGG